MDKNKIPLNIYLDLSKAFDTLDHAILFDTLFQYGIRGNPLKLISIYLENRQQFVEFRNTKSNILQISTGVPQGSMLGPLLFLIYINHFPSASSYFNFIMYAPDTTLYSNIDSSNQNNMIRLTETKINAELAKIDEWQKINKLSFFFFFFRLFPSGVATADFLSPVSPINCILLRHFNLSHVLFHHIHKPPFWPSPFPLSWQLHPQHPSPNIPIIFPPKVSIPSQSCLSCFLSKLSHLCCPSDVLIPDLVHSCHS